MRYVIVEAHKNGVRLEIYILETRPECDGYLMYKELSKANINCFVVPDASVGIILEKVDYVVTGAELVTENGGIINRLGTYTLALCAKALEKPVYVLAENFKFSRTFPLSQNDLPDEVLRVGKFQTCDNVWGISDRDVSFTAPKCDLTPSNLISFIVSDSRIFKPTAISDEMLQLFNL